VQPRDHGLTLRLEGSDVFTGRVRVDAVDSNTRTISTATGVLYPDNMPGMRVVTPDLKHSAWIVSMSKGKIQLADDADLSAFAALAGSDAPGQNRPGAGMTFAPTNFSQVYLRGMGLFALQLSPQPLVPFAQLFYSSTTEKPIVADDSQLLHTSVNANHLSVWFYIVAFLLKNNVQVGLVLYLEQVCRTSFPREVLLEMFGDEDGNSHPASQCQDVDAVVSKVHRQGAVVVADRTTAALGTGNLLAFLLTSHHGGKCFCGFGSGGNGELGFQSSIGTDLLVGQVVQTNPVELLVVPSGSADEVESVSVCLKRWLKHFLINFQLQFSGSYLFHIPLIYMSGKTDFLRQNPNFLQIT
jgi:hypothetical protein